MIAPARPLRATAGQSQWLHFLVSNVSDISSDPGLAALNGTSFYVSDINFLSNEALAWRGLATFVRIVDRYIGE